MNTMKAVVFHGVNDIRVEEVARPRPRAGEAVIRLTATTICGTDVHIVSARSIRRRSTSWTRSSD
jgi:threonine dehydrogenase-like Zn-dependent dehydrogenase